MSQKSSNLTVQLSLQFRVFNGNLPTRIYLTDDKATGGSLCIEAGNTALSILCEDILDSIIKASEEEKKEKGPLKAKKIGRPKLVEKSENESNSESPQVSPSKDQSQQVKTRS